MSTVKNQNRQIHLDFHSSGLISGIAKDFDPEAFAQTLKNANVAKVCLFTRCHHGYCYYPTQVGTVHPHATREDLLGEQISALAKVGIEHSLYSTICWDELSAHEHPEWISVTYDNHLQKIDPLTVSQVGFNEPGWKTLCWNGGYRQHFKNLIKEALERYDTTSLFLDILMNPEPCCCNVCVSRMETQGLNPNLAKDRKQHSVESAREFMDEINATIHATNPKALPFYNARLRVTGVLEAGSTPEIPQQGELCIESLPSGPWGYDHFPINAKHFQNFGKNVYGMTGKFQKMWGDFGGLKNQAALDFEVARMVTHGMAANVGDQLHPHGVLDPATYELIGRSFEKTLNIEDDLIPSTPIDEIGVLLTNAEGDDLEANNVGDGLGPETGAMKMLMQSQMQFSFLDESFDLNPYALLILPDHVRITPVLETKLKAYLAKGGKIIASYESGFNDQGQWALGGFDFPMPQEHPSKPYFVRPNEALLEQTSADKDALVVADHVFYQGGKLITELPRGTVSLASIKPSFFNRTWDHFCSHLQTPPQENSLGHEMISNQKNLIYFASPIFGTYETFANKISKSFVKAAIDHLMGESLIVSNLPSTAETTLRKNAKGDSVLSILHYLPQRRGDGIDIIEDVIDLHEVSLSVRCDHPVKRVIELTTGRELDVKTVDGRVIFNVPRISGTCVCRLEQ